MTDVQIIPLAAKPDFADACAAWSYGEWGCHIENGRDLAAVVDSYKSENETTLPKTWVAIADNKPVGMARLKNDDHPDEMELTPWLGGLFVHPLYRNKGIASQLCAQVEQAAQDAGFNSLYLFTGTADGLYQKRGYKKIKAVRDPMGFLKDGETLYMKPL